jgi:hypothetical protein
VTIAGVEAVDHPYRIGVDQLADAAAINSAATQPWAHRPDLDAACAEALLVLPWFGLLDPPADT